VPNRIPKHFSISDVGGKLFLTVSEVCALLDADPRSIRKEIRQGRIPHTQVGREYRILSAGSGSRHIRARAVRHDPGHGAGSCHDSGAQSPGVWFLWILWFAFGQLRGPNPQEPHEPGQPFPVAVAVTAAGPDPKALLLALVGGLNEGRSSRAREKRSSPPRRR